MLLRWQYTVFLQFQCRFQCESKWSIINTAFPVPVYQSECKYVAKRMRTDTNRSEWVKSSENTLLKKNHVSVLLGHAGGLIQFLVCSTSPSQSSPPFAGEGLVHVLVRVWVPPPHVLEHVDHSDQSVNPPFTADSFEKKELRVSGQNTPARHIYRLSIRERGGYPANRTVTSDQCKSNQFMSSYCPTFPILIPCWQRNRQVSKRTV